MIPVSFAQNLSMRLTGILFFIIFFLSVRGQQNNATIKGYVTDTVLKKGLSYTTISLVKQKDSTLISFARADSNGVFKLTNISPGSYLLSFSYVGYSPVWKPVTIIYYI
jgi:hypothetical protein